MNRQDKNLFALFCIAFFAVFLLALPGDALGAEQEQERIVEKVTVTNVEVPVRVLYKGEPVSDLTKEDFVLYENRKKMEINGFFLKRKTIKIAPPPHFSRTCGSRANPGCPPAHPAHLRPGI